MKVDQLGGEMMITVANPDFVWPEAYIRFWGLLKKKNSNYKYKTRYKSVYLFRLRKEITML